MLDRYKLMQEIERVSDKLFVDFSVEKNIAREVWKKISDDPTFKYKVAEIDSSLIIPSWQGRLDDLFDITKNIEKYVVLSVDGSQIYPDRHHGTMCNLINIGTVQLRYGLPGKAVIFNSEPHLFVGYEDADLNESPKELVNCRRQEFEFLFGFEIATAVKPTDIPTVLLFDGSLIFWHLESKSFEVKQKFLSSYLHVLKQFYDKKMLIAGYISLPKSKELLNLIRVALCDFVVENCSQCKEVDHLVDSQIAGFYLQPFTRTTIFKNYSKITKYYPKEVHPHFFYMHVGDEIVRIEIPAWIAQDKQKVDMICTVIADQTIKGMGYPVALAESHEQAVVKGADREFFYHLIDKIGMEQNRVSIISQKSRKKLGMGI